MKVILVDDHRMMRDGLRAVLERSGIDVVGEASNGREALTESRREHPDVVIVDIAMPELNGIDATRRIRAEMPTIKVVTLTMNADRRYVTAMLDAGASGYVLKNAAAEELLTALRAVVRGETYLSPALSLEFGDLSSANPSLSATSDGKPLTPREREVLQLIAEGSSSKDIASALGIAVPTVETHRRQIAEKLNLKTIAELTKYAIREGLTSNEQYTARKPPSRS